MNTSTIVDLKILFEELKGVLQAEGGGNWLSGINAAIERLSPSIDASANGEHLREVKSIFATMHAGQGSFSDFFIWREDFDERMAANAEFKTLKDNIWSVLEQISVK